jgi:hypothetical protein
MKKFAAILILCVLVSYCKDDNSDTAVESKIYFTGLEQTDYNGYLITIDSTDWGFKDIWLEQESALFNTHYGSNCVQSLNDQVIAYPNPCNGVFYLSFQKSDATAINLRLVDQDFKVLLSMDTLNNSNIAVATSSFVKDTVRLYYRFIENNCEFRGHGDILIK